MLRFVLQRRRTRISPKMVYRRRLKNEDQTHMGIKNYGNTCYLGSTIKLIKQIPGLEFSNSFFQIVYQTPENQLTDIMIWNLVRQCGFSIMDQNDAMELLMKMLMDVVHKQSFEISWELHHYIKVEETPLLLMNGFENVPRSTLRTDKAYQIRLCNLADRSHESIQEMIDEVHFSAGGPGDTTIYTEFNDPDYSPQDYIEHEGLQCSLGDIMKNVNTSKLPSCKREVYQPSCEYLVVSLDVIDYFTRMKKTNVKVTNLVDQIRFSNGISYSPISIICHMGSTIHHGHYMNYTLDQGSWTLYNDDRVWKNVNMKTIFGVPCVILYKKC
jgi:uncharacterized UBP type Zn finger protein